MSDATPRFLLTFDTELFWGLFFLPRFAEREREMAAVRPALERIVGILDSRGIPATFAAVGRLFFDEEEPGEGPLHPDLPPGWPGPLEHPEAWFGRDLVERIRRSQGGHEIAGHGHVHLDFDRLDLAGADRDVGACVRAAQDAGLTIRSWVFPRNRVVHPEVLACHGIRCYRAAPSARARSLRFLDLLLARGPLVGVPDVDRAGLVVAPAGIPILPGDGVRRLLGRKRRGALVRKGLEEASRTGGVLHLWTHPHNFVRRGEAMLAVLEDVADEVARARERDGVEPVTMDGLADAVLGGGTA